MIVNGVINHRDIKLISRGKNTVTGQDRNQPNQREKGTERTIGKTRLVTRAGNPRSPESMCILKSSITTDPDRTRYNRPSIKRINGVGMYPRNPTSTTRVPKKKYPTPTG